ncbi:MAG: TetR/AcrR family transcriptional regulator [Spirochaetes bacterium]|nr:TetR/AcrR family transcriptional regulator [Spirochaetota bacterium]
MIMQLSQEIIITSTLDIIDELGSSRGIKFREIARRVGCSHVSLYNYFNSFDDLLLCAARYAITELRSSNVFEFEDGDFSEQFVRFNMKLFDYVDAHKGRYLFIWTESPAGKLYSEKCMHPEEYMAADLLRHGFASSSVDAHYLAALLHGYFHGEMMKYVVQCDSGRSFEFKTRIAKNVAKILELHKNIQAM